MDRTLLKKYIQGIGCLVALLLAFNGESPLKPLIILCALNLLLRENFPFSNFPMYASFSNFTYYVYITNEADEPIAVKPTFGVSCQFVKKRYDTEVQKQKDKNRSMASLTPSELSQAGRFALEYLAEVPTKRQDKSLRLYQVNLTLKDKTIVGTPMLVAQIELGAPC